MVQCNSENSENLKVILWFSKQSNITCSSASIVYFIFMFFMDKINYTWDHLPIILKRIMLMTYTNNTSLFLNISNPFVSVYKRKWNRLYTKQMYVFRPISAVTFLYLGMMWILGQLCWLTVMKRFRITEYTIDTLGYNFCNNICRLRKKSCVCILRSRAKH